MDELAQRAVAATGWRWLPGMLTTDGARLLFEDRVLGWEAWSLDRRRHILDCTGALPDLTDDLTRLGLLALVRRVRPYACVEYCGGYWRVVDPEDEHWDTDRGFGPWCSEAEALVAALEAAP